MMMMLHVQEVEAMDVVDESWRLPNRELSCSSTFLRFPFSLFESSRASGGTRRPSFSSGAIDMVLVVVVKVAVGRSAKSNVASSSTGTIGTVKSRRRLRWGIAVGVLAGT